MKKRLADKINHPMYGKKHTLKTISSMKKFGSLNPMFNKTQSTESKLKISLALSKTPLGLYDKDNNLIKTFVNQVELAAEFGVFKTTISSYIKSGKLLKKNII
nr:GIY-YIG endonuclease [Ganoderma leucocontextum]